MSSISETRTEAELIKGNKQMKIGFLHNSHQTMIPHTISLSTTHTVHFIVFNILVILLFDGKILESEL